MLLVSTWTSYKTIIKILQLQKEEARHVLILYLFCYSGFVAVFDILSFVKLNQSLMKEQLYKVDQETRGNSKIRWLQLSRFAVLGTIVRHFCLYNPTGLLLLNIEILWKFKYFLTNWYVVWTKKYVIFQLTIVQLHLMSNLMVRCIVPCHYVGNSNIEMPLKYAPIKVLDFQL